MVASRVGRCKYFYQSNVKDGRRMLQSVIATRNKPVKFVNWRVATRLSCLDLVRCTNPVPGHARYL
jgi:hypothetical protein